MACVGVPNMDWNEQRQWNLFEEFSPDFWCTFVVNKRNMSFPAVPYINSIAVLAGPMQINVGLLLLLLLLVCFTFVLVGEAKFGGNFIIFIDILDFLCSFKREFNMKIIYLIFGPWQEKKAIFDRM